MEFDGDPPLPLSLTSRAGADIERFCAGPQAVPPHEGAAPEVAYVGLWGAEDPEPAWQGGFLLLFAVAVAWLSPPRSASTSVR